MSERGEVAVAAGGRGAVSVLDGDWDLGAMARSSLTWRSAVFLLAHVAFSFACFVGLVIGVALSLALSIIWVGIPLLVMMMLLWRAAARAERGFMRAAFGVRVPSPYRERPQGSGPLTRLRVMAADPATWKDLLYLALAFPIAVAEAALSIVLWAPAATLLATPLIVLAEDGRGIEVNFGLVSYWAGSPLEAVPVMAVGVGWGIVAMYGTRIMAVGHAFYARLLLGPSVSQAENRELRARTEHLRASRARGVDAVEFERRRIERDLHDGAQQRLLAVAMDIGRARAKLAEDPEGARALIEQAHAGTKEAITELRDLARGIYPAILTDRGLDPALSGLAGRAPVPVEVSVDLPDRPPAAVESIAYFIVAEALANIAKYARATRASVRVTREDTWVVVEIIDDGVGGAVARPDGGLAGLADRAATIDGMLIVDSPPGGPTIIRADLPCSW
ncbi:sensor histidine kinase [Spirillospora sp. NPDC127200]